MRIIVKKFASLLQPQPTALAIYPLAGSMYQRSRQHSRDTPIMP